MAVALLILCCLSLAVAAAVAYYFDWKKRKEEEEEAENKRFLNQPVPTSTDGSSPVATTVCQTVSDNNLTWSGHRGLAELETWGSFNFDKCATYPVAYTTTPLFSRMYQKLGAGSPKNEPALTEDQQIDDSGTNVIENIVSKKKLELATNGVLSLRTVTGTAVWSTPSGAGTNFKLKFDTSGNLCVFDKNGNTPWCMLPKVTVQQTSTSGGNLATLQQQQLAAGNMKNTTDTAKRFVMIDDAGRFCMYRGTPGNIQGNSIVCK
jgi:hypothetical protein